MFFVAIDSCLFSTNVGHEEQEDKDSWDTWFLHDESTYSCIQDYYDTEDGKMKVLSFMTREALIVIMERKTIR